MIIVGLSLLGISVSILGIKSFTFRDPGLRFVLFIPIIDFLVCYSLLYLVHFTQQTPISQEDKGWLCLIYFSGVVWARSIGRLCLLKRKNIHTALRHIISMFVISLRAACVAMLLASIVIWSSVLFSLDLSEGMRVLIFGIIFPFIKIFSVNAVVGIAETTIVETSGVSNANSITATSPQRPSSPSSLHTQGMLPKVIAGANVLLNSASILGIMMSCAQYESFLLQFLCHALLGKLSWIVLVPRVSSTLWLLQHKILKVTTRRSVAPLTAPANDNLTFDIAQPDGSQIVSPLSPVLYFDQTEVLGREAGETLAVIIAAIASFPPLRDYVIYANPLKPANAYLTYNITDWLIGIGTAFVTDKIFTILGVYLFAISGVTLDATKVLPHDSNRDLMIPWTLVASVFMLLAVGRC